MTATRTISFTLNGEQVSAQIASHHSLLEVVRNDFSLYGARESCGQGLCGCCTLIVDGRAVVAERPTALAEARLVLAERCVGLAERCVGLAES